MKNLITLLLAMFALVGYSQTIVTDLDTTVVLWTNSTNFPDTYQETVNYDTSTVTIRMHEIPLSPGNNTVFINGNPLPLNSGSFVNGNLGIYEDINGAPWDTTLILHSGDVVKTVVSNNGKMTVSYKFTHVEGIVSVNELTKNTEVKLYPNPTVNIIKLEFGTNVQLANYNVFDLSGGMLLSGTYDTQINVSHLPSGTYILQLNIDGEIKTEKFIK